jgi:hypothetical protein
MNGEFNKSQQNTNTNINILEKILQKENETLKRISKDKLSSNDTLSSLLQVLELQRERINCLEEGIKLIYIKKCD